jgi:hypothetical protein
MATIHRPEHDMHFARTRKRLTAWLGLAAMVLVFFAPVVSQQLALHALHTAAEHAVPPCEAQPMAAADCEMPADHHMSAGHEMPVEHQMPAEHHMLAGHHMPVEHSAPADHHTPADHHAACGYCDLLAHHVPAPLPIVPMAQPAPDHALAWRAASERLAVHEVRHAGRPRDSPFLA